MNNEFQKYAREKILSGLKQLPESNQKLFKRMYSHKNLDASLDEVVAVMPADKLDWAMQQVANTLKKKDAAQ